MKMGCFTVAALVAALAAGPAVARADDGRTRPEEDFKAANERFLAGDLPAAINLYEHLANGGAQDPAVFLNLGNAQARLGKTTAAILAYERGLVLAPGDADLLKNLAILRGTLQRKLEAPAEDRFTDVLRPVVGALGGDPAAWTLVVLAWVGFALLTLSVLRRGRGRALAFAVLLLALAPMAIVGAELYVRQEPLAVSGDAATVHEGPDARMKSVLELGGGERLRILRDQGSWLEVQTTDGVVGWVARGAVTVP